MTSVAPRIPCRTRTSDAARLSVRIWAIAASRSASDVRPGAAPAHEQPRPEPLRQQQHVARARAALAEQPVRVRGADDREPVLRLRVADRVAAGEHAARLADLRRGRLEHRRQRVGFGKSSGNAAIDSANSTRPPIANTSESALAAAISPYAAGSSTSGGKKSSVPRIARSSLTRYAAASSGGSRPAMRSAERRRDPPAPSPESASASRSAPSFAAQPPHSVSSVRRIGGEPSRTGRGCHRRDHRQPVEWAATTGTITGLRERRGPGGSPGLQNRWRGARRRAVGSTPMRSRHPPIDIAENAMNGLADARRHTLVSTTTWPCR